MLLVLKVINVSLFLLQREYFEKQILENFELKIFYVGCT
jgi:hypothetical protein